MRTRSLPVLVAAALAFGAAIAVAAAVSDAAPTKDQVKASRKVIDIPASASKRVNPRKPDQESIANGKLLFASQCAMCHGKAGSGDGDLAGTLKLEMPDFTSDSVQAKRTDGDLFYILTNGCGDMPGEGEDRLTEDTRWDLVNYVRTLAE